MQLRAIHAQTKAGKAPIEGTDQLPCTSGYFPEETYKKGVQRRPEWMQLFWRKTPYDERNFFSSLVH